MPVRVLPVALTDIELWRLGVKRAVGALEALAARMPVEGWDDEPVMLHAEPGYVRSIDPGQPPRYMASDPHGMVEAYGWDWVGEQPRGGGYPASVTPLTAMRMVS